MWLCGQYLNEYSTLEGGMLFSLAAWVKREFGTKKFASGWAQPFAAVKDV